MKNAVRLLGLVLALMVGSLTSLDAQSLADGTWTGKGVDPGGDEFPLSFEVSHSGDSLQIAMVGPDGERMPLTRIRFEEGKLLFTWEPGPRIDCTLSPVEGGGFSGPCTDEDGGTGIITMTPPQSGN
jgi:hypothetical protein